jgi:hypothetical protein
MPPRSWSMRERRIDVVRDDRDRARAARLAISSDGRFLLAVGQASIV